MHSEKARRVAAIVGLACYWPYFRRFEFEYLFGSYTVPSAMWSAYTLVTFAIALLLVMCALRCRAVAALVRKPLLAPVSGAVFSTGYLATIGLPALCGPAGETAGLIGGAILLAAGFCGLTLAWMCWLAEGSCGRVLEDVLISFVLCSVLLLAAMLPAGVALAFTVAYPLVSGLLWWWAGCFVRGAQPADAGVSLHIEGVTMPSMVAMCLLLLIGRITAGLAHFDAGEIRLIERVTQVVVSCMILGAMLASARRANGSASMIRQTWLALVVVFLTGETVVVLAQGVMREVGLAVFWAGLLCFEVLILAVAAAWCRGTGRSAVRVMCIATLLLRVVPNWVGKFAVPAATSALGVDPSTVVGPFVLASSLVLMSATLLLLNALVDARGAAALAEGPETGRALAQAEPVPDAAETLAQTYLLTARETDVLRLLLQGLSYQAVADRLDVGLSTVQSYIKASYRKMDVHSRDELVARAEAVAGAAAAEAGRLGRP